MKNLIAILFLLFTLGFSWPGDHIHQNIENFNDVDDSGVATTGDVAFCIIDWNIRGRFQVIPGMLPSVNRDGIPYSWPDVLPEFFLDPTGDDICNINDIQAILVAVNVMVAESAESSCLGVAVMDTTYYVGSIGDSLYLYFTVDSTEPDPTYTLDYGLAGLEIRLSEGFYWVSWGDSLSDSLSTHTYAHSGAYTLEINVFDPCGQLMGTEYLDIEIGEMEQQRHDATYGPFEFYIEDGQKYIQR